MTQLSFFSDKMAHSIEFFDQPVVVLDDFIDSVVDIAGDAGLLAGQPDREIPVSEVVENAHDFGVVNGVGVETLQFA
jgi:hypothetical protein